MDLITYIPDLNVFRAEAVEVDCPLFTKDSEGVINFLPTKIPVFYAGNNESLCLVRINSRHKLSGITGLIILGECKSGQYIFDDQTSKNIYERLHNTKPINRTDENGKTYTVTPAYMMGVFA